MVKSAYRILKGEVEGKGKSMYENFGELRHCLQHIPQLGGFWKIRLIQRLIRKMWDSYGE